MKKKLLGMVVVVVVAIVAGYNVYISLIPQHKFL